MPPHLPDEGADLHEIGTRPHDVDDPHEQSLLQRHATLVFEIRDGDSGTGPGEENV